MKKKALGVFVYGFMQSNCWVTIDEVDMRFQTTAFLKHFKGVQQFCQVPSKHYPRECISILFYFFLFKKMEVYIIYTFYDQSKLFDAFILEILDKWMPEIQIRCLDSGLDVNLSAELFKGKTIMDLFNFLLTHNQQDFRRLVLVMAKVIPRIVHDAHEVRK